ncbi:MAG: hypothetical protein V1816_25850 [Pseudomonadota bacterium]
MLDLKNLQVAPPWEWPENSGKIILKVLTDSQAEAGDRLIAAELAGESPVIDDKIAAALLAITLNNEEAPDLRAQAVISLGPALEQTELALDDDDIDDAPISEKLLRRITTALQELFLDAALPANLRRRVLEASVHAPRDWHQDAVREAYLSSDPKWKLTAVFCMQFIRGFAEQILEALNNPDPIVQEEAVTAAANWELRAAWPRLEKIITASATDHENLRLVAIDAAPFVDPQKALDVLSQIRPTGDEIFDETLRESLSMAEGLLSDVSDEDDNLL